MAEEMAIEADGLVEHFGETRAVDGLDLRIPTGSVYGVLGPNGAGKTTAIRVLATLLLPTAGSARVFGHDVMAEAEQVRSENALMGMSMMVLFPLTFISNVFVPPETLPTFLEALVDVNPITFLVTAMRGLIHGGEVTEEIALVLAISAALVASTIAISSVTSPPWIRPRIAVTRNVIGLTSTSASRNVGNVSGGTKTLLMKVRGNSTIIDIPISAFSERTCSASAITSWPKTRADPAVGNSRVASTRIAVVLPAPL